MANNELSRRAFMRKAAESFAGAAIYPFVSNLPSTLVNSSQSQETAPTVVHREVEKPIRVEWTTVEIPHFQVKAQNVLVDANGDTGTLYSPEHSGDGLSVVKMSYQGNTFAEPETIKNYSGIDKAAPSIVRTDNGKLMATLEKTPQDRNEYEFVVSREANNWASEFTGSKVPAVASVQPLRTSVTKYGENEILHIGMPYSRYKYQEGQGDADPDPAVIQFTHINLTTGEFLGSPEKPTQSHPANIKFNIEGLHYYFLESVEDLSRSAGVLERGFFGNELQDLQSLQVKTRGNEIGDVQNYVISGDRFGVQRGNGEWELYKWDQDGIARLDYSGAVRNFKAVFSPEQVGGDKIVVIGEDENGVPAYSMGVGVFWDIDEQLPFNPDAIYTANSVNKNQLTFIAEVNDRPVLVNGKFLYSGNTR
ncbi:hypothetical protein HYT02_03420 [Candidatus Gottesmanbacteria bacterium]|nr:hypothetical protein [Candidatus Gottesmanbacteria bacterium]